MTASVADLASRAIDELLAHGHTHAALCNPRTGEICLLGAMSLAIDPRTEPHYHIIETCPEFAQAVVDEIGDGYRYNESDLLRDQLWRWNDDPKGAGYVHGLDEAVELLQRVVEAYS